MGEDMYRDATKKRRLPRRLLIAVPLVAVTGLGVAGVATVAASAGGSAEAGFNQPGNVLIADQFNNRVVELDAENDVVWHFGVGPNDVSPTSIVGVNDAQRVGDLTLMAGTGVPAPSAGSPPLEPGCPAGCADNRVMLVDREGHTVWQYGKFGITGNGVNELNSPVQATYLPNGHVLITDQGNARVIEVTRSNGIAWQYPVLTTPAADQLNNPNSAELLANGHILIADENNNRAIEVTRDHKIVATFEGSFGGKPISGVAFASRLPNGNTLLTDSNNNRVLELTGEGKSAQLVWSYDTTGDLVSNSAPLPTRAIRLRNGDTLISDQFNDRVIEVDHAQAATLIRQWGTENVPGFGRNAFNAPYDAKVIGDFTGLTPPRGVDDEG
jgi:hypothetical protein